MSQSYSIKIRFAGSCAGLVVGVVLGILVGMGFNNIFWSRDRWIYRSDSRVLLPKRGELYIRRPYRHSITQEDSGAEYCLTRRWSRQQRLVMDHCFLGSGSAASRWAGMAFPSRDDYLARDHEEHLRVG